MSIALFDPSICTENLGDYIILDSVTRELQDIFPHDMIVRIPTQDVIGTTSKNLARKARHRILGGTNILSSRMLRYRQWKLDLLDTRQLQDVTLMGVGWWQYQESPDLYTRTMLRRLLSTTKLHSVRDSYTFEKLKALGFENVINTGCPTMWRLTPEHCLKVPTAKGECAVVTLTDYNKVSELDQKLLAALGEAYRHLYFWPQGSGDLEYVKALRPEGVTILPPTLAAFDALLDHERSIDFVGTRLHGGIRALQRLRRALIVAVDNRAREIAKDTSLPVLERSDLEGIRRWITVPAPLDLRVDFEAIQRWRQQTHFDHVRAAGPETLLPERAE